MDRFSYFIVFYSLILGLALTELLGGFAQLVRARVKLEPQVALLALYILLFLCSTWVDGWVSFKSISVDFAGLAAPVGSAIFSYLASAVVFPHREADHEGLSHYFDERKRFVVGMLLAAEMLVHLTYGEVFRAQFEMRPMVFWTWSLPYNVVLDGLMVALLFVRSRRANITLLAALMLLTIIPYWNHSAITNAVARYFHEM